MKRPMHVKEPVFNPMKVAGILLGNAVKELDAHMAAMATTPRRSAPMITGNIKKRK